MLPLRTLSYTLTILLLSSCSVTKSLYKDKEVSRYNPNVSSASKNYSKPAGEDTSDKEAKASGKQQQPVSDSLPETETPKKLPYRYPLPRMTFGETESANVRIPMSLNNPFPPSGELEIPLAELESDFCYPYPGKQISGFGYRGRSMHTGVDIKAVPNDTIRAAFSGVVRMSKPYSGYGNIIVIRHYNGMETAYAHNSRNLVTVNDVVKAGDPIALAGRTGRATTEHLHFEFRVANQALNPSLLLDTENCTLSDMLTIKPYFIKPNIHEFSKLYGGQEMDMGQRKEKLRALYQNGVQNAFLTLGAQGMIAMLSGRIFRVSAPPITPKSTVGAGDSTLSAFACAKILGYDNQRLLRFASACGAATAASEGSGLARPQTVGEYLDQVEITEME